MDTDIVLDLFVQRKPFFDAAALLFSLADSGKIMLFITPVLLSNLNYILSKSFGRIKTGKLIRTLRLAVSIASIDQLIVDRTLSSEFKDLEDGLQYFAAVQAGCGVLLTRNIKDYQNNLIAVMTAEEWLSSRDDKEKGYNEQGF